MVHDPRTASASRARGAVQFVAIAAAATIVAIVAGGFFLLGDRESDVSPVAERLVVTVRPSRMEHGYHVGRAYVGAIEPRRRSAVGFELNGRLVNLFVDDGEAVDTGMTIARLDTARLRARRAELVAARAEAHARAELARATFDRASAAFDRGAVSEQELDEREEARDGAVAALERIVRQIDSIDVDLDKSVLRAPYDAIVARRHVDEGQVIDAGTPVFELYERQAPEARIGVPADAAQSLEIGQTATVRVHDERLDGHVRQLLPSTERGTRTIEVVLELDAELDDLRRGDLATFTIDQRIDRKGFWLPMTALTESARGLWACFVAVPRTDDDGGRTHEIARRQLELIHTASDRVYVDGTLAEGELVVLDGRERLVSGQLVRIIPAAESES